MFFLGPWVPRILTRGSGGLFVLFGSGGAGGDSGGDSGGDISSDGEACKGSCGGRVGELNHLDMVLCVYIYHGISMIYIYIYIDNMIFSWFDSYNPIPPRRTTLSSIILVHHWIG